MKEISSKLRCIALLSICLVSADGAEIVNFDASSISKNVYVPTTRAFSESKPILATTQNPDYEGPTLYGGFQTVDGHGLFSVSDTPGAGLKLRWNQDRGVPGEKMAGLFLFKREDFINVSHGGAVFFEKGSDSVLVKIGYLNPGKVGPELAVNEASFRFVFKDDTGYHISASAAVNSASKIKFVILPQTYYHYIPGANSGTSAGTIGEKSTPSFRGIEFVGFHLEAIRGGDVTQGANIGVTKFTVDAKSNN